MLTPIWPAWILLASRSARAASLVQTLANSPYFESFAIRIASFSSSKRDHRRDRPEDLLLRDEHAVVDLREHRRRVEGARAVAGFEPPETTSTPSSSPCST